MTSRNDALKEIRENIQRHGYHLYIVTGGAVPRYAYTIGLSETDAGAEILLAGCMTYLGSDLEVIVAEAAHHLKRDKCFSGMKVSTQQHGQFELREVNDRWQSALALGAIDYYNNRPFKMFQLLPDQQHATIDVPDMSRNIGEDSSSAWQWLWRPWTYHVSPKATATTNLCALKGALITEAARWEADEWELFAGSGPDVDKAEIRVVPIGTLLAHDPTLLPVLDLEVGKALWRESPDNWQVWN